jgi:hypothetical protein
MTTGLLYRALFSGCADPGVSLSRDSKADRAVCHVRAAQQPPVGRRPSPGSYLPAIRYTLVCKRRLRDQTREALPEANLRTALPTILSLVICSACVSGRLVDLGRDGAWSAQATAGGAAGAFPRIRATGRSASSTRPYGVN